MNQQILQSDYNFGIREPTHSISVRSTCGKSSDSKTFSISAVGHNAETIRNILVDFLDNYQTVLFPQDIIFSDDLRISRTHDIVILPEKSKEKSRSFSIKIPSHSSFEIAEAFKSWLYGKRLEVTKNE